ncbi:MAG: hypothetical protein HY722_04050 [Planctomycetes bacterium]|nr:hypothetical protein [Planctomycetota bacterium]
MLPTDEPRPTFRECARDLGQSEEEARASVAALARDEGYTLARRRRRQFGAVMAIERALGQPEDEAKARFNAMDVEKAAAYIEDHADQIGGVREGADSTAVATS